MTLHQQSDTTSWPNETGPTEYQYAPSTMKSQRANRSDDISDLVLALSKAQGAIVDIPKDRTVTVTPRNGGPSYQFKYATLSSIIHAIRKPLSDNGLAYTQIIARDDLLECFVLTTTLHHGNQFISSTVPLIMAEGSNQQFGSALTYMKRYTLAALLGIAPDEDDDGNAADGNEVKAMSEAVAKTPKAPAADPISSGVQTITLTQPGTHGKTHTTVEGDFNAGHIDVPLLPDENGSDWMKWGQTFMAMARKAHSVALVGDLEAANSAALATMQKQAPKMYTNMSLALIKLRKDLEKAI